MLPLTQWSITDVVVLVLFALIVSCVLLSTWLRRRSPEAPPQLGDDLFQNIPMTLVLVGYCVPWQPWLRDSVVLIGFVSWLGLYLTRALRGQTEKSPQSVPPE